MPSAISTLDAAFDISPDKNESIQSFTGRYLGSPAILQWWKVQMVLRERDAPGRRHSRLKDRLRAAFTRYRLDSRAGTETWLLINQLRATALQPSARSDRMPDSAELPQVRKQGRKVNRIDLKVTGTAVNAAGVASAEGADEKNP